MKPLDALRVLARDKALVEGLGKETAEAFVKLKSDEWTNFTRSMTAWERENTLDC